MRTPPHAGRTQNFAPCAIAIVGLLASLLASLLAAAPAHSRSVSAAKASDRTAAVLALLPADVIFVAGVSVTRLRANPALAAMVLGAGPDSGVARVKKVCRLDPLRQVDSAVLAVGDGWRPALYLATTGVSEAQVVACATALLAASWGTAVETRRDGAQVTLLSAGSGNTRRARELVFVLPGVVFIPLGDNDGRKAMPPPATGGGLLHEPNMAAALQQVRMSGLAWGAGLVPGEGETRVVFVAATVELPSASQEPVLDARIRFIAATAARELEETLKREFASAAAGQHPIARLLKRLTTTVEDRDVVVRGPLAVDAELVRELGRMGFGPF